MIKIIYKIVNVYISLFAFFMAVGQSFALFGPTYHMCKLAIASNNTRKAAEYLECIPDNNQPEDKIH